MIKTITSDKYIYVHGAGTGTYISKSYSPLTGSGKLGDMMYDFDNQCMKVFDGQQWQSMYGNHAIVGLTEDATMLLDWARHKRNEELELEKLAKEHTSVNDLVNDIKNKKDQIKMIMTLIKSPGHDAGDVQS